MKTLSDYAAEIVLEASVWWNLTGRHLVAPAINEYQPPPKVRHGGVAPTIIIKHAKQKDLNDGVLLARVWADLTKTEKKRVYHAYLVHHWLPAHPEFQEPKTQAH